mmetsp:Transcript_46611/g.129547  ORF Transcript_46611/g.129547 Transcript_46611/m.129547 type:complete len:670 (+) Transcript_46611:118-2127(+)
MPMRITLLRKNLLLVFRALSSRRTSSISCALTPQQQPTSAIDRTSAPTLQTWPRTHARRRPHASTRPEPAPCARSSLLLVARERVGAELATADGAEVGNDALELGRRERGLLQDEAAESRHRGPVRVDGAADERRVGDGLDEPRLAGAGARLDEDAHQLDLVIEQVLRRDGGEARDALAQQPRAVLLEAAKGRLAERAGGLSATHEKTEESEHRARVLELLVADTADARLEERRRARQLQQQPRLKDEASVVHLPKRRQQLRLRLGVRCRVDPCARGLDEAAHDGGERVAHVIIGGVAAVHLDGLRDARETADDGGGREGLAHLHQQRRQQRREQLLERGHRGAVEVAERLHHVVLRAKHLGGRLQQRPDGLQHRQQRVALRLERVAEFDRRGDELQLRRHQGGRVGGGRRARREGLQALLQEAARDGDELLEALLGLVLLGEGGDEAAEALGQSHARLKWQGGRAQRRLACLHERAERRGVRQLSARVDAERTESVGGGLGGGGRGEAREDIPHAALQQLRPFRLEPFAVGADEAGGRDEERGRVGAEGAGGERLEKVGEEGLDGRLVRLQQRRRQLGAVGVLREGGLDVDVQGAQNKERRLERLPRAARRGRAHRRDKLGVQELQADAEDLLRRLLSEAVPIVLVHVRVLPPCKVGGQGAPPQVDAQ